MWDNKKSVLLSRICVVIFMITSILGLLFGNQLIDWFMSFSRADILGKKMYFILTCYSCAIFVIITLYQLNLLLKNMYQDIVFSNKNVLAIRICSWCCFIISSICIFSTFYYFPFFIVFIVMAFIGLILRIIKNIFEKAIIIKEENELTI